MLKHSVGGCDYLQHTPKSSSLTKVITSLLQRPIQALYSAEVSSVGFSKSGTVGAATSYGYELCCGSGLVYLLQRLIVSMFLVVCKIKKEEKKDRAADPNPPEANAVVGGGETQTSNATLTRPLRSSNGFRTPRRFDSTMLNADLTCNLPALWMKHSVL